MTSSWFVSAPHLEAFEPLNLVVVVMIVVANRHSKQILLVLFNFD